MSHRQQTTAEQAHCGLSNSFWERHRWLDAILVQKAQAISTLRPVLLTMPADPMPVFLNLVAQSTLLSHCTAIELLGSVTESHETAQCRQRALMAAQEIVRLTGVVSQLSYFEVSSLFLSWPLDLDVIDPSIYAASRHSLRRVLDASEHGRLVCIAAAGNPRHSAALGEDQLFVSGMGYSALPFVCPCRQRLRLIAASSKFTSRTSFSARKPSTLTA